MFNLIRNYEYKGEIFGLTSSYLLYGTFKRTKS